jgi:hypothetical protein
MCHPYPDPFEPGRRVEFADDRDGAVFHGLARKHTAIHVRAREGEKQESWTGAARVVFEARHEDAGG